MPKIQYDYALAVALSDKLSLNVQGDFIATFDDTTHSTKHLANGLVLQVLSSFVRRPWG